MRLPLGTTRGVTGVLAGADSAGLRVNQVGVLLTAAPTTLGEASGGMVALHHPDPWLPFDPRTLRVSLPDAVGIGPSWTTRATIQATDTSTWLS